MRISRIEPAKRRMTAVKAHKQAGLSLVELMMTTAISAILVTAAVPSFAGLFEKVSIGAASDDLYGALRFARSEAIARNSTITVCKARDGVCNASADWHEGWVVFVDEDADGDFDDGAELPVMIANNSYDRVESTSDVTDFIRFRPDGSASSAANFGICGSEYGQRRDLSVTVVGQARTGHYYDSDCS